MADENAQLNTAIGLYVSREISLSKAAETAGVPICDFIEILKDLEIPSLSYDLDMLEDDLEFSMRTDK